MPPLVYSDSELDSDSVEGQVSEYENLPLLVDHMPFLVDAESDSDTVEGQVVPGLPNNIPAIAAPVFFFFFSFLFVSAYLLFCWL